MTPSLNVYYKNTRIKQYHNENRALRTETPISNSYDFGIGKRLHNLSKLRAIGFAANRRLLDVERLSHDCMLTEDTFQTLKSPGRGRPSTRLGPALRRPARASALAGPDPVPPARSRLARADLRRHLAFLGARDPQSIMQAHSPYQLRRLRLHGLIERLPNSFRYRVTEFGWRAALFFTRLYNRLLRPGLAAALPGLRAINAPLKRAFDILNTQVNAWINQAKLPA